MKDAAWQPGGGNIPATKATFRSIALHTASDATSNMEIGEIAYLGDGLFHAKNATGTFTIPTQADLIDLEDRVDASFDSSGKVNKLTVLPQSSAPSTAAGEGGFYAKTVSGKVELFFRYASDGAELQLTTNGALNIGTTTGPYLMNEQSAPTTAANQGAFYTKEVSGTTEAFFRCESSGTEVQLTSGGALNAASKPQIIPLDVVMDDDYPGEWVLLGTAGYKVWAIKLADGADRGFTGVCTLPDSTKDYQLVLEMAQSSALTGRTVAMTVQMKATQAGETPIATSNDVSSTQAISCRNDTNMLVVENSNFKIAKAYLHTDNQQVRVRVLRDGDGTSATDDHTGDSYIYNAYFKAV